MRSSEKESRKARLSLCARDGSFYKDLGGSGGESLENPSLYNPAFEVPGHENIIYRCHPAGHRFGPEFRRRGQGDSISARSERSEIHVFGFIPAGGAAEVRKHPGNYYRRLLWRCYQETG